MRALDAFRLLLPCTMLLLLDACSEREGGLQGARAPSASSPQSPRLATIQSGLTDALSAADTTSTTTSVMLAPRARMPVNAW